MASQQRCRVWFRPVEHVQMTDHSPEICRSECLLNGALEFFGDCWSLLIVRDLLQGPKQFGQILRMEEGISTGTLTNRLTRLVSLGVLERQVCETDRRAVSYELTEKGRALEPVLLEMALWMAEHTDTAFPPEDLEMLRSRAREICQARAEA
jgi:DNA-binding HxlR family transcriptional regulator